MSCDCFQCRKTPYARFLDRVGPCLFFGVWSGAFTAVFAGAAYLYHLCVGLPVPSAWIIPASGAGMLAAHLALGFLLDSLR